MWRRQRPGPIRSRRPVGCRRVLRVGIDAVLERPDDVAAALVLDALHLVHDLAALLEIELLGGLIEERKMNVEVRHVCTTLAPGPSAIEGDDQVGQPDPEVDREGPLCRTARSRCPGRPDADRWMVIPAAFAFSAQDLRCLDDPGCDGRGDELELEILLAGLLEQAGAPARCPDLWSAWRRRTGQRL